MPVQDVPNPLIHKVSLNPGNEVRKAKTKLDEIMEEKEVRAAQRYSAATLDQMAIEAENEAARLRGEPPKYKYHTGGEAMDDDEKKKQEAKQTEQREKITTQAVALINSGMEPAQVGQMLMGLTLPGAVPVAAPQGMGLEDILKIVTLVVGKKDADELKDVIADLSKKVEDITKNPPRSRDEAKPLDPILFARQQAEAVVAWNEALEQLRPAPVASSGGKPLDIVKEENRHSEKMEEIKGERDYKKTLTDIASEIPERVGRGIAGQFGEGHEESGDGGSNTGMEYIECGECKTKIPIPPTVAVGGQITCQKCGAIWAKGGTVESKTE